MSARERFQELDRVFRLIVDAPPDHRAAILDRECAADIEMRQEIEEMLEADALPIGELDRAPEGFDAALQVLHPLHGTMGEAIPTRIQRYHIVRCIGRGGMGEVYEAHQDSPRRAVAVKVMRPGAFSRSALARFRREAQALGRLQHPGIAQVFEAGVDDWGNGAQPYIAMELVQGTALLPFVREATLSIDQRLILLARLCDAVHHAHQKGVIHRDLKPANILVVDDDPACRAQEGIGSGSGTGSGDALAAQPKILDFGVARLLDPDSTAATLETSAGQIIGTVPYMSPEQAAGDSAAIDIRTDVYSLGVIAFEVLGGRHPLGLDEEHHGKPLRDALHAVREQVPPLLGTIDRRLRGDIETVVAKAMEKRPGQRYASAAEFAADLRRIVRHETVAARRTGTFEQVRKFARRNRALVAFAGLALVALVGVAGLSLRLAVTSERSRWEQAKLAREAADRAEEAQREAYRGRLAAAAAALGAHDAADARHQLHAVPQERRGWEWRHLSSRVDDSLAVAELTLRGTTYLAFSGDGRHLHLAEANGGVQTRRASDLTLLAEGELPGNFIDRWATGIVTAASPDRLLILCRRWLVAVDPLSARVEESHRTNGWVRAVDSRGSHAVIEAENAAGEWSMGLVRLSDGAVLAENAPHRELGGIAEFSAVGGLLALCGPGDQGLLVLTTDDGRTAMHRPDLRDLLALRFDRLGSRLAAATREGTIHVLQLDGGPDIVLGAALPRVAALDFHPDGAHLATGGADGAIRIWNLERQLIESSMRGHGGRIGDLRYSPDGSRLVSHSREDRTLRLWSATEEVPPFAIAAPGTVYSLCFSADGRTILSGSLGGTKPVRLWGRASATCVAAMGDGPVSVAIFDPTEQQIAIGRSQNRPLSLLRRSDGADLGPWKGTSWRTDWLAFEPGGASILRLSNEGVLSRLDLATGDAPPLFSARLPEREMNLGARAVRSPDGSTVVVAHGSNIVLLDAATWTERGRLTGHEGQVCALAMDPTGTMLASAGMDRVIRLWSMKDGESQLIPDAHTGDIYALAFSPDGLRLASGGTDRLVRIWDPRMRDLLVRLEGHSSFVYCLAWSPDGECLVSGGGDATIRLWDTRPFEALVRAREARANAAAPEPAAASPDTGPSTF